MNEKTHTIDKGAWPNGPWTSEPDKVQFRTAVGLPALIVRNHLGALCGYVGVARGHRVYGVDYSWVDAHVQVHGGLTYSDRCRRPICHVPAPGEPDDVWWQGFDTAHSGDLVPGIIAFQRFFRATYPELAVPHETYRDLAYVRAECESLARQLSAMDTRTAPRRARDEIASP